MAALLRCGELCRGCSRTACFDKPTKDNFKLIECPDCGGLGYHSDNETKHPCKACSGDGSYRLEECPRHAIGPSLAQTINLASWAAKGHLPEHGGILDQDAWFMSVWGCLDSETNLIETERMERGRR